MSPTLKRLVQSNLESLSNSLLKQLSKRKAHSSACSLPFPKRTRQTKRARSPQQDIEDPSSAKYWHIQNSAYQHGSPYQAYKAQASIPSSKRKPTVPKSLRRRFIQKEMSRLWQITNPLSSPQTIHICCQERHFSTSRSRSRTPRQLQSGIRKDGKG